MLLLPPAAAPAESAAQRVVPPDLQAAKTVGLHAYNENKSSHKAPFCKDDFVSITTLLARAW
jgi:hypothetical protein